MIPIFLIIVGILLLIFSIIDWKVRKIPSILLTAILFAVAVIYPEHLFIGIVTFMMAYLLYEAEFFNGVADIKIMTMIGFLIPSVYWLFAFTILTVVFGFLWKVLIKWRMRNEEETAFIPIFFFIYVTLYILGAFV